MIDLNEVIDESIFTQENPEVIASVKPPEVKKVVVAKEDSDKPEVETIDDSQFTTEIVDTPAPEKQAAAIKATAEFIQSIGGFEKLPENFNPTPEALVELIQAEAVNKAKSYIEQREEALPSIVKDLLEDWEEGMSDDVLLDIFNSRAKQVQYSTINKESLKENTPLLKSLYTQFLKETTKFSETKINKMVQEAEDNFTLEDNVLEEALPELTKIEASKEKEIKAKVEQNKIQAEKDYKETLAAYKKAIESTDEILGVKLSKKEREELFNLSTKPVGKDKAGNPVFYAQAVFNNDPIAYNMAVNMVLMKTEGLKNKDGFIQAAATKATKILDKNLDKSQVKYRNSMDSSSPDLETADANILNKFYETYSHLK